MARLGIDEEQVETISVDSEPEEEESNYRRLVHQLDSIHIMFLHIPILFHDTGLCIILHFYVSEIK